MAAASKKKDFTQAKTGPVYSQIEQATAEEPEVQEVQEVQEENSRKVYTGKEALEMQMNMTTQGRKGCKAARINMAFAPDVYDYLKVMSSMKGQTVTKLANEIIRKDIEQNAEAYRKARSFIEEFRGSN